MFGGELISEKAPPYFIIVATIFYIRYLREITNFKKKI